MWSVCPIRARHVIDLSSIEGQDQPCEEQEFYQDDTPLGPATIGALTSYNLQFNLVDTEVGEVDANDE